MIVKEYTNVIDRRLALLGFLTIMSIPRADTIQTIAKIWNVAQRRIFVAWGQNSTKDAFMSVKSLM